MTKTEITIQQFVDSPWFKVLSRGAAIVGSILAMAVTGYFLTLGQRVEAIEKDRTVKIIEHNNRLDNLDAKLTDLQKAVADLADDASKTRQDTALMKGMLQQIQRQTTACDGAPAAFRIDPASP